MKKISGGTPYRLINIDELKTKADSEIEIRACVHKLIQKSGFYFVMLKTAGYVLQAVYRSDRCSGNFSDLREGRFIKACGIIKCSARTPHGIELHLTKTELLSSPAERYPLSISDKVLDTSLEEKLEYRSVSLRHPSEGAVFRVKSAICTAFRSYMLKNGFTEIHTPKIVPSMSESRRHAFELDYFGEKAYLAQSPQFYKQAAIAAFDRVFETGSVFRAEKHGSARHLNEFTSLDFETGYISDLYDITEISAAVINEIITHVNNTCRNELEILGTALPQSSDIPSFTVYEALDILGKPHSQGDLDPTDEVRICEYGKREYGSELVFITHFPEHKRPFYIKNCANDNTLTESFDLLMRGMEIASGGQRIHDYNELIKKLADSGISLHELSSYTDIQKYGIPPHGGAGFGLERLTMQLLKLHNIRQASLFPRDLHNFI